MYTFQGMKRTYLQINKLKNFRNHSSVSRSVQVFVKKNLLLTNSITSGAFMALGDFVEQEVEIRRGLISAYDWTRIGHMFAVGTLLGPLHHYYYLGIDKLIPKVSIKTVSIKILCDQLIAGPLTIVSFYYGMGLLESKPLEVCTDEIKKKFLKTFAVPIYSRTAASNAILCVGFMYVCKVPCDTGFIPSAGVVFFKEKKKK